MRSTITSRQHPLCKLARSLHDAKGRRRHKLFLVEGGNAVVTALRARWPLQRLLMAPEDLSDEWETLAQGAGIEMQPVDEDILQYLSDTETSPGIIALAQLPMPGPSLWDAQDLVLTIDGVSDPGNVGTLIRAADAAGAGGVLLTEHSADAFNPKAVRATAGSIFHLPPLQVEDRDPFAVAEMLQAQGIPIVAAVAHDGQDCYRYNWPRRCALALGHETRGVSPALEAAATARVTIPIYGRAESLNVAMAGTVLLYAWRQSVERG